MPLQPGFRIADREDQRVVEIELKAVKFFGEVKVGAEQPAPGHRIDLHDRASAKNPLLRYQHALEGWRGVEAPEMEGGDGRRVTRLPKSRREDHGHEGIDHFPVFRNDREIFDGMQQRRRLLQFLPNLFHRITMQGVLLGDALIPEVDQGRKTEKAFEGKFP